MERNTSIIVLNCDVASSLYKSRNICAGQNEERKENNENIKGTLIMSHNISKFLTNAADGEMDLERGRWDETETGVAA